LLEKGDDEWMLWESESILMESKNARYFFLREVLKHLNGNYTECRLRGDLEMSSVKLQDVALVTNKNEV